MASPLQWIFQLVDKVSGPAHAAGKSLGYFEDMAHEADKAVDKLLAGLGGFELLKGAGELAEKLGEKLLEMGIDFGKATIEAGLFEQKSSIAFEVLAGSAEKAKAVMLESKGFANQFAISYAESAELFKVGLLKGLKFEGPNSITQFAQIGVDLEKMGLGSAKGILEAFGDVQEKGVLTARSLLAFKETGINFDLLAKKLNIPIGKGGAFTALQQAAAGGGISSTRGLPALLDTLGDKFGVLGGTSQKMGNLIDGQFQKLKNSWEGLLGRVAESGALDKIANVIGKIAESMDPATDSGKKWALAFDRLFEATDRFLELLTPENLKSAVDTLSTLALTLEIMVEWLAKAVGFAAKLAPSFGSASLDMLTGGLAGLVTSGVSGVGSLLSGGSDVPKHGDGGHFSDPHLAIIGDEPETIIPDSKAGSMRGGSTQLHLEQHFHVTDSANVDTKELARLLHELSLGDLQGAMDTLAQQAGVA